SGTTPAYSWMPGLDSTAFHSFLASAASGIRAGSPPSTRGPRHHFISTRRSNPADSKRLTAGRSRVANRISRKPCSRASSIAAAPEDLFERRPRGRFIPALAEQRTRIDESLVDVCVSSRGGVPQKGDVGGDAHLNQQHEQLTESRQPRSGVAGDPPA